MNNIKLCKLLSVFITLIVPVFLVLLSVRILLSSAFLQFEYNLSGFPEDPFGFTKSQRLYWSNIALDYLLNAEGIDFLANLQFENNQPVYNERELIHMVDVKQVVQQALNLWYCSLFVLIITGIWARLSGCWREYRKIISMGGWLTIGLVVFIILFVLVSFDFFFVTFHNIFFMEGTWTFLFSDTLIRLFPERFWRDTFILVGTLAIILGLSIGIGFRVPRADKKKILNENRNSKS